MALVVASSVLILLAMLAILTLGYVRLSSPLGILRDGLPPGTPAPQLELIDTAGVPRRVPGGAGWQILLFANHSLREFKPLLDAVAELVPRIDAELIILHCGTVEAMPLTLEVLQSFQVSAPVVHASDSVRFSYNVRVLPLTFFVDLAGTIRSVGLVTDAVALRSLWIIGETSLASATPNGR